MAPTLQWIFKSIRIEWVYEESVLKEVKGQSKRYWLGLYGDSGVPGLLCKRKFSRFCIILSFPNFFSKTSDEKIKEPGQRAADINAKVIPMLGGPWSWGANVVALDYVMSTNLIDIAIHTNQNKIVNLRQNVNMTVVEI